MLAGTLKVWNPYEYADPFHGGKGALRKDVIEYVATIIGIRTTQWDFYCQRRVMILSAKGYDDRLAICPEGRHQAHIARGSAAQQDCSTAQIVVQ
jgi:hypothetical protein